MMNEGNKPQTPKEKKMEQTYDATALEVYDALMNARVAIAKNHRRARRNDRVYKAIRNVQIAIRNMEETDEWGTVAALNQATSELNAL